MELGLFQSQGAAKIRVDASTIWRWERNETQARCRRIPRVIQFLGYNPLHVPETFPERLVLARQLLGLTQRAMAKRLGVDPTTLGFWERGERRPSKNVLRVVDLRPLGFWIGKIDAE
ncbi:MAG: helix-turn-helix transcriptional regulator [Deltaproteobacteria bacterium]|nr:helix-turn-helix transcriptional regulator [Deltaproteobacteria bacterium]